MARVLITGPGDGRGLMAGEAGHVLVTGVDGVRFDYLGPGTPRARRP